MVPDDENNRISPRSSSCRSRFCGFRTPLERSGNRRMAGRRSRSSPPRRKCVAGPETGPARNEGPLRPGTIPAAPADRADGGIRSGRAVHRDRALSGRPRGRQPLLEQRRQSRNHARKRLLRQFSHRSGRRDRARHQAPARRSRRHGRNHRGHARRSDAGTADRV